MLLSWTLPNAPVTFLGNDWKYAAWLSPRQPVFCILTTALWIQTQAGPWLPATYANTIKSEYQSGNNMASKRGIVYLQPHQYGLPLMRPLNPVELLVFTAASHKGPTQSAVRLDSVLINTHLLSVSATKQEGERTVGWELEEHRAGETAGYSRTSHHVKRCIDLIPIIICSSTHKRLNIWWSDWLSASICPVTPEKLKAFYSANQRLLRSVQVFTLLSNNLKSRRMVSNPQVGIFHRAFSFDYSQAHFNDLILF